MLLLKGMNSTTSQKRWMLTELRCRHNTGALTFMLSATGSGSEADHCCEEQIGQRMNPSMVLLQGPFALKPKSSMGQGHIHASLDYVSAGFLDRPSI
jgi:hypothetical protein